MLTIKGTRGDKMILGIPNLDVGTKISIVIKTFCKTVAEKEGVS